MHREYHPDDMRHLSAHAFEGPDDHDHDQDHDHRSELRRLIGVTALLGGLIAVDLLLAWLAPPSWRAPLGIRPIWIAALFGAFRIVYQALEALLGGKVGADVALAIAAIASLILREPFVAAEVVFIALVGEALEALTADRAMRSIRRLFDQSPRIARVRRDGQVVEVPPHEVQPGETVIVGPGERVPVDGPVLSGRTAVDQSALTGEPMPVDKGPGETVHTGSINQFGTIEMRAERVGHESTFGQVLLLVAEAQRRKAPLHRTADRLAGAFLPFVLIAAGLTIGIGLLMGWPDAGRRAVAVLVVACPCALILATPAAVMAAMAWLARHGVVIKGGAALERLARCNAIAFDKTGTVTIGAPEPARFVSLDGRAEADLLALAAAAETGGGHPLARALVQAAKDRGIDIAEPVESTAKPGLGVEARFEGDRIVFIGNRRLIEERGLTLPPEAETAIDAIDEEGETALLVAEDGRVVGVIGVRDRIRPEAHDVIHDLKHLGFRTIALLTGDREPAARAVAKRLHIKTVGASLLPAEKAEWIEARRAEGLKVAMVGDGINDAAALATADVGVAIGGVGADLAAEAGDVVLLGDPLACLPDFVTLSRATVRIIRQNIIGFAFGLNGVAIALAFAGVLGPVAAAILHQLGSLLVLLNAMRLLGFGDWHEAPPFRRIKNGLRGLRSWDDHVDFGSYLDTLIGRWRWILGGVALGGGVWWLGANCVTIAPEELGVVRRFGRFQARLEPGIHARRPWPVERIERVEPWAVRSTSVGYRPVELDRAGEALGWESEHDRADAALASDELLALTGDGQLVELTATVQYRLGRSEADLRAYLDRVEDADEGLRALAESGLRSIVGRRPLSSLLTEGRADVESALEDWLTNQTERLGLGLDVLDVTIRDAHPPLGILDAYRDVARAERDAKTRRNEATAYRDALLAKAKGEARALVETAEADRRAFVASAAARADAFRSLESVRRTARSLTDERLRLETFAEALAGRPKLLLDSAANAPRRHVLLPAGTPGSHFVPLPMETFQRDDQ